MIIISFKNAFKCYSIFWIALAAEYFKRRCMCHCQACLHESSDTIITEVLSPFLPLSLLFQISKPGLQYYNCIYVDLKRTAFPPNSTYLVEFKDNPPIHKSSILQWRLGSSKQRWNGRERVGCLDRTTCIFLFSTKLTLHFFIYLCFFHITSEMQTIHACGFCKPLLNGRYYFMY